MRSAAAKRAFFTVLALTLAWKIAAGANDTSDLEPNILALLAGHGFVATVASDETADGFPVIHASRGDCRLQVMVVSYYGADRDVVAGFKAAGDKVMFIYRGTVYPRQPVLLIVSDQIRWRFLRSIGLSKHDPPVLAVTAPARCEADQLPWAQIE